MPSHPPTADAMPAHPPTADAMPAHPPTADAMPSHPPTPDAIARCVLSTFDSLPSKRKPRHRDLACREWVPLAGIVLSTDGGALTCVALGTGMKCLPAAKIASANGAVLHDWHAEILALRAFNCFLIRECNTILDSGEPSSSYLRLRGENETQDGEHQLFAIKHDVSIHMYCSEAPCGDASMELTMEAQQDSTPWSTPANSSDSPDEGALRGRGYFSQLGVVRLKPSRPDAPPTLSKSCTDKLALKQCTSLLNSITATLLHPRNAYLSTLTLPASQHVSAATLRAFSAAGRMARLPSRSELPSRWPGGYHFHPFTITTTALEFNWSRRSGSVDQKLIPCNLSAVYIPTHQETVIGGVLQGRKVDDPRGASMVSRRGLLVDGVHVLQKALRAQGERVEVDALKGSYAEFKTQKCLEGRSRVKDDVRGSALKGWARNEGDEGFRLDGAA